MNVAPGPLLLAPIVLVGCVTADGVLRPDDSVRLELLYVPGRHATVQSETKRLGAERVSVASLEPRDRFTAATLDVRALDALANVTAFEGATLRRTRDGEAERLDVRIDPPNASQRAYLAWVRQKQPDAVTAELALTLPGTALAGDPRATIDGDLVRWRVDLAEWEAGNVIELWVRWTAPSPAAPHSM